MFDVPSSPLRTRWTRQLMSVSHSYPDEDVSDDTPALLEGLRNGERAAQATFFDRYVPDVEKVLFRMLGPDSEFEDLIHETFIQSVVHIHTFRGDNAKTLRAWVRAVATRTAGKRIRRRQVRKILSLQPPESFVDIPNTVDPSVQAALQQTYTLLERIPADDRIPFLLRFVHGMNLNEIAETCEISLSTVKRRIQRGRERFLSMAHGDPLLKIWLETEEQ